MNPLAGTPVEETTLETERLLLEPLLPEHAALLFEDLADERLYRFIPTDAPELAEALESRYRKLSSRRSPDGSQVWLNFAMRLREGTTPEVEVVRQATYVGTLEATVYPDRSAYIAYSVFVPFWRQGYAREGCARMLRHLLEDYRVRVVVAEMDTRNAASVALAESLGFGRVGTTLGADHFKGSVSDEHRYELHVDGNP
jgi:[ribosomal protein S5]-alanine N-acetyltransferase